MLRRVLRLLGLSLPFLAVLAAYLVWETDRNMVRRWVYPVQGQLAAWSTRCEPNAPRWLAGTMAAMASSFDSQANQLAFVSADGQQSTCVNGWQGLPLLSERLAVDTRMRLASLSKIVSFVGMTQGHSGPEGWQQWLALPLTKALQTEPPFKDDRIAQISVARLLNHSAGFDRLQTEDVMVLRDQKPWCPNAVGELGQQSLQFSPGTRYAYGNLSYCLAAVAYEKATGRSLWQVLDDDLQMRRFGLAYWKDADSTVTYNFMHHGFYGPDFPRYFDWSALRAPMGMTGNAQGLARFISEHRAALDLSRAMRDDSIPCDVADPKKACFDGFLERREVNGKTVWMQRGYVFGMSAVFLTDEPGNLLVWIGAGESSPSTAAAKRWAADFATHTQ